MRIMATQTTHQVRINIGVSGLWDGSDLADDLVDVGASEAKFRELAIEEVQAMFPGSEVESEGEITRVTCTLPLADCDGEHQEEDRLAVDNATYDLFQDGERWIVYSESANA